MDGRYMRYLSATRVIGDGGWQRSSVPEGLEAVRNRLFVRGMVSRRRRRTRIMIAERTIRSRNASIRRRMLA